MSDGALSYALSLSGGSAFLGTLNSAAGGVANFAARVGALAAPLAALTGGVGALGIAMKSLSQAADMESIVTSMGVLTGGADKAKKLLDDLRQMGASTPYEFPALATGAQTMLSFGIATDQILPLIKMLGDISMGSADKMGSLTLVMGQVASAGRLTGGDLLQFINAGFNPLVQIAARTGEEMSDLRKRMEEGGVGFDEVRQAMLDATSAGGAFYGMMGKMAGTTQGLVSTLKDEVNGLFLAFGQPINDAIKPILTDAIAQVSELKPLIASVGESAATGLSRVYAAASSGRLGALLEAELLYVGANFVNFLGGGFHDAVQGLAGFGSFLGDAMSGVGSILTGHLLDAGQTFAAFLIDRVGGNLANLIETLPGMAGAAANLRGRAARTATEIALAGNPEAEAQKSKGKELLSLAYDAMVRAGSGGKVIGDDKMAELKSDRDEIRTVLDREIRAEATARKKAAEEVDALAKAEAECAAALMEQESALKKAATQTANAPAGTLGALGEAIGSEVSGGDAPGRRRSRVLSASESLAQRFFRMSKADKEKFQGWSSMDLFSSGGGLAEGAQAAREVGATISPQARALGDSNRAAREKPETNRDLASILRKIEENTAAFAEVALAT